MADLARSRFAAVVLAAGCLAACDDGTDGVPPTTRLSVDTAGGPFTSPFPAQLEALLGSATSAFEFSASASSDRGAWNLHATLTREQAIAGRATLNFSPDDTALAKLRVDGSKPVQTDTGTVDLTFAPGRVTGTVTDTNPDLLDGTFDGALIVDCWVPLAAIPPNSPSSGTATAPDGEALVLDQTLASDSCAPFHGLR